jgi:hypothetical protein
MFYARARKLRPRRPPFVADYFGGQGTRSPSALCSLPFAPCPFVGVAELRPPTGAFDVRQQASGGIALPIAGGA